MSGVKHSTDAFRRNNSSGISKGQAQFIALFLVLALVPTTLIVAQNATNSTPVEGMVTDLNLTDPVVLNEDMNESLPDAPQEDKEIGSENNTTILDENVSADNQTAESNATFPEENDTVTGNTTAPEGNTTYPDENITVLDNTTISDGNLTNTEDTATATENHTIGSNETLSEENATVDERYPILSVDINNQAKTLRGEDILITATLTNDGDAANDVILEWVLPEGFSIHDGNAIENVGSLGEGETFVSQIKIRSDYEAELGVNDIKVRVSYE